MYALMLRQLPGDAGNDITPEHITRRVRQGCKNISCTNTTGKGDDTTATNLWLEVSATTCNDTTPFKVLQSKMISVRTKAQSPGISNIYFWFPAPLQKCLTGAAGVYTSE